MVDTNESIISPGQNGSHHLGNQGYVGSCFVLCTYLGYTFVTHIWGFLRLWSISDYLIYISMLAWKLELFVLSQREVLEISSNCFKLIILCLLMQQY